MEFSDRDALVARLRGKKLFFIGGAIKSGTTWLRLLLDSHSQLGCGGEGHFINQLGPVLDEALASYNRVIHKKNKIFQEAGGFRIFSPEDSRYLLSVAILLLMNKSAGKPGAIGMGEKTPDNVEHFAVLRELFPQARFINIVRDGRDAAISAWFHNRRTSPEWFNSKFQSLADYVDFYGHYWAHYLQVGEEFRTSHPDRCHTLRYEDLLADPQAALTALLGFLGVDDDAATVEACLTAAAFEKLSGGRRPGEENRESFFRKGVCGDWRNYFDDHMAAIFRERADEWLERYGYPAD